MKNNDSSVAGVLEYIRFHKNNYLIGNLDSGVSVKGNMLSPQKGMEYTFSGRWEHHPTYGRTFLFGEYRASYPKELGAIRAYLKENCKWIGDEISKKLVNAYGEDVLNICKDDPERVAREIPGITPSRAREITDMLVNNQANEELQIELGRITAGTPVTKRALNRIIEAYGREAPEKIKENPYRLIEDIDGIGFLTADEVAMKVGYKKDGGPRIKAGIAHVLKESAYSDGHTCLPLAVLFIKARALLDASDDLVGQVLKEMIDQENLVIADKYVYLPFFFENERLIASQIKSLLKGTVKPGSPVTDGLQQDQSEALSKAMDRNVFILTGPPGTGKTYTIKTIIRSFPDARIALAAPSGKASKRMYEESGMLAQTIHKLLEPQKEKNGFYFTRDAENPIDADIIILDEVSMIDVSLMASLLDAVSPETRLVMVGDVYQLPSVGPGNVLKDLIASGTVPCKELDIIKRQDEGLIIRNCHRIKNGQDIELENSTAQDFFFLKRHTPEQIRKTVFDLLTDRLQKAFGYDPLKDVQIISPLREKTPLSCRAFNEECQKLLNPNPPIQKCRFKKGDKVIQTKNQYELDIINGDIGYIRSINLQERTIYVDFENPDRNVQIPLDKNNLDLAYAITVHKFQGSEAPVIIIPVHKCFGTLITQRNLLYTAVSRAKKLCIMVGQRGEIRKMINRNKQQARFTNLARFLRE